MYMYTIYTINSVHAISIVYNTDGILSLHNTGNGNYFALFLH